jgi:hypothetical protein
LAAEGGDDEEMQELPEDPRPSPGPRTRAQQAAAGALAAADLAIGIGSGTVGFARSVFGLGQPSLDPVVSPLTSVARIAAPLADFAGAAGPQAWLRQAAARGRRDREALVVAAGLLVLTRVAGLINAVLDQLDLTAVVTERADTNAVAGQVDVDAIARRVDVIAVLDRVDPAAVTRYLIEELDLPAIIQSSTGSIVSDTVHDVRMQSISADERLSRAVGALLLRRRSQRKTAPGAVSANGTGDGVVQAAT